MEPTPDTAPQRPRLHPLVATAAVSVILLSVVGIGALLMNRSNATPSPYDAPVAAARPLTAQPVAPATSAPILRGDPVVPPTPVQAAPIARAEPTTPTYVEPREPARPTYEPQRQVVQAPAVCRTCGVVDSIHDVKVKGQGTGVGGVGGAVVGGLLGNQIGAGNGKALATVAGAVGGAFAGNAIEKNVRSTVNHRMTVRLDDGTTRTFTQANPFPYTVGERVRVVNGVVRRG